MKRTTRHWSLYYLYNRLRLLYDEKKYPSDPWFPRTMVEILDTWIKPEDVGFEWGSGRSTLWFAHRVSRLISVEDHPGWYENIKNTLQEEAISNVDYHFISIDSADHNESSKYVQLVMAFPDAFFDFILVDGKLRSYCAALGLAKVKPGGIIIVDDAQRYLSSNSRSPYARSMKDGPLAEWQEFAESVRKWRNVWVSNGVTDTAFWVKPA